MKIIIETIPHDQQRYETAGDWFWDDEGVLQIRASQTGKWESDVAVAIHELAEALFCKKHGITQEQVDEFDKDWKSNVYKEPGDDPNAPYYYQHLRALDVEESAIGGLGMFWDDHEKNVDSLFEKEENGAEQIEPQPHSTEK